MKTSEESYKSADVVLNERVVRPKWMREIRQEAIRLGVYKKKEPKPRVYGTRFKAAEDWKWLCWDKNCRLNWEARYVFSKYCHLWFNYKRKRVRPTEKALRAETGFRSRTVEKALADLAAEGLIVNSVPTFKGGKGAGHLIAKANGNLDKWYLGTQGRMVRPKHGDKLDVLLAFIEYANATKQNLSAAFLVTATGIRKRTVERAVADLAGHYKAIRRLEVTGHLEVLVEGEPYSAWMEGTIRDHLRNAQPADKDEIGDLARRYFLAFLKFRGQRMSLDRLRDKLQEHHRKKLFARRQATSRRTIVADEGNHFPI